MLAAGDHGVSLVAEAASGEEAVELAARDESRQPELAPEQAAGAAEQDRRAEDRAHAGDRHGHEEDDAEQQGEHQYALVADPVADLRHRHVIGGQFGDHGVELAGDGFVGWGDGGVFSLEVLRVHGWI